MLSSGKSTAARWRSLTNAARCVAGGSGIRTRVTISSGRRTVFQIPSAMNQSFSATERVPAADVRSTEAFSVIRTGGVSAE